MGPADTADVSAFLEAAQVAHGHPPLGERKRLVLLEGGDDGFTAIVARDPGGGAPVGYAQLAQAGKVWALEIVADHGALSERLLGAARDIVRAAGGGHLRFWVPKPAPEEDSMAIAAGLHPEREVHQLRRTLPAGSGGGGVSVRPFQPDLDEQAVLEVNNRAFLGHDEQGGWTLDTLRKRETQQWFDTAGFLLHEREGRLAGFCWTKIDTGAEANAGEIYVVAVDPDFQGQGLGRALTLAGLDHLARRGVRTATLYVDADNAPARKLYESLGFELDHIDRAYVGDVAAAAPHQD